MQLVRIAGPTEAMRRLGEIDGLHFERSSANRLDEDTWQVAGYASDDALAELQARGLQTELVVPAEKLAEERRTLFAAISREDDGASAGSDAQQATDDEPTA
ncbi:MAG: hypothetical protein QOJ35_3551 [Solirubrobacteraceae bacterium]|jgi:hypothetical protein|nr:hypothetical protein [Solirubrobacteraceae bacterium]